MDYQELFEKEDDYLIERFELARGRIAQLAEEGISSGAYQEYFSFCRHIGFSMKS